MKLGAFDLYAISDGSFLLDGGQMFSVVPKVLWEKRVTPDARNRVRLGLTCLLIRTGLQNILVETGIGDKFDAKQNEIYRLERSQTLLGGLQELGIKPKDIDMIINTHLHFDHCGWNVREENGSLLPTFPRARYLIQRGEWEDAQNANERNRASYIEKFYVAAKSQTEFLNGDTEIVPGVRVEVAAGHTQHMQCVRVESEGKMAYFPSDLVPTIAHLPYAWMTSFDLYPLETLANKKRLLPELVRRKALLVFAHDPSVPWVRLVEIDGKITAEPVR